MRLSLGRLRASDAPWIDEDLVAVVARLAGVIGEQEDAVEFVIVDDPYIQNINATYRGNNQPTDVISFSYTDGPSAAEMVAGERPAGEIYVSFETLEKEARAQGLELTHLFLRIAVHGMLHVVGYDHRTDEEADIMEGEERRVLRTVLRGNDVDALFG